MRSVNLLDGRLDIPGCALLTSVHVFLLVPKLSYFLGQCAESEGTIRGERHEGKESGERGLAPERRCSGTVIEIGLIPPTGYMGLDPGGAKHGCDETPGLAALQRPGPSTSSPNVQESSQFLPCFRRCHADAKVWLRPEPAGFALAESQRSSLSVATRRMQSRRSASFRFVSLFAFCKAGGR